MFLKENVALAVAGLKSNKMRAFLTMLGIIIGIGSVIAIVSIGNAITGTFMKTMSSMGAGTIYGYVSQRSNDSIYSQMMGNSSDDIPDDERITEDQIETMKKDFSDNIKSVTLYEKGDSTQVKNGKEKYANISIYGVNADFFDVEDITVSSGRIFSDKDVSAQRNVAVVSDKFASNLFAHENPIGKTVDIDTDKITGTFTVIGVYKSSNSNMGIGESSGKDTVTDFYIPVGIVKQTAKYQNYYNFELKINDVENSDVFSKRLQSYFDRIYKSNTNYKCTIYNEENMLSKVSSTLNVISIAIAAIAAIALLVGGIGVMNIMLVSVTERTREIGTRKALGARSGYIRMQFIVESVIICVIGGIIGVIFGLLLAWGGTSLMHAAFTVSVPVIFISVGFSMLIGIFFGYYPAKKAAGLDPIDALRYE